MYEVVFIRNTHGVRCPSGRIIHSGFTDKQQAKDRIKLILSLSAGHRFVHNV